MGHASYGNNSDQDPVAEKPAPTAAAQKPAGGKDRPGTGPGGAKDRTVPDFPASGPHGDPDLTNRDSTPGAGTLPDAGDKDATDSTSS